MSPFTTLKQSGFLLYHTVKRSFSKTQRSVLSGPNFDKIAPEDAAVGGGLSRSVALLLHQSLLAPTKLKTERRYCGDGKLLTNMQTFASADIGSDIYWTRQNSSTWLRIDET